MPRFNPAYGFLRPQCPNPAIAVSAGGNLTAGSLWVSIIRQNRVGFDIPAPLQQITWTNGQKVVITLPSTLRVNDSEDVHRIWVIAAASNNLGQTVPLTCWRGYTLTQIGSTGYYLESRATLPATIELTQPQHVALGATAANPTALLTFANPIDGMQLFVTSLNKLVYYDPLSTRAVDGSTVLSAGTNPGRWIEWWYPQVVSIGAITNTTLERGANQDSRTISDAEILQPPPVYALDGTTSNWVQYTIFNGYEENGTAIAAGTRLLLDAYQSGVLKSQRLSGRILCKVLGISRFSDGSLSTSGLTVGAELVYEYGDAIYTLEQDLNPGYGLAIAVAMRMSKEEVQGGFSTTPIAISPYFSQLSSNKNPAFAITGNTILAEGDRRRIFPKRGAFARIGSGAATILSRSFQLKGAFDFVIPQTGVTNQKMTINDQGDIFWRGSDPVNANEVQRAIVGLRSGRSNPSPWSSYTAFSASNSADISITYPVAIRSNYPDVIASAGAAQGAVFNAPFAVLYVQRQSDGQIREFPNNATLASASQTFNLTSFTAGTVIGSLPTISGGDFGCWAATTTPSVAASTGGSFGADSYRFAYAFRYDGGTLTDIDHSTVSGNIPEAAGSLGSISDQVNALQAAVDNLNGIATKTTASFTQPAIGLTVTISVESTVGRAVDELVLIAGGGRYQITAINSATSLTVRNPTPTVTGNVVAGTTVLSPAIVSPSGAKGEPGSLRNYSSYLSYLAFG